MSRSSACALSIAALLAFILKIALALNTYGTNDVLTWEGNAAKINADGGLAWYRDGVEIPVTRNDGSQFIRIQLNNHPPFVIHMLQSWDYLARISGLPFRFWLRFTSSLADIGSLIFIWKILTVSKLSFSPCCALTGGLLASLRHGVRFSWQHRSGNGIPASVVRLSDRERPPHLARRRRIWIVDERQGGATHLRAYLPAVFSQHAETHRLCGLRRRNFRDGMYALSGSRSGADRSSRVWIWRLFGVLGNFPADLPSTTGRSIHGICGGGKVDRALHHSGGVASHELERKQAGSISAMRSRRISFPLLDTWIWCAVSGVAGSLGRCIAQESYSFLLHRERSVPLLLLYSVVQRLSVVSRECLRQHPAVLAKDVRDLARDGMLDLSGRRCVQLPPNARA